MIIAVGRPAAPCRARTKHLSILLCMGLLSACGVSEQATWTAEQPQNASMLIASETYIFQGFYKQYTYDAQNRVTRRLDCDGGFDRVFYNADDNCSLTTFTYDSSGRAVREAWYSGKGADNQWYTADDVVWYYYDNQYDAAGNLVQSTFYQNPGADGLWFTADDVISSIRTQSYNAANKPVQLLWPADPGTDGIWLTGDDWVIVKFDWTYDIDGKLSRYEQDTLIYNPRRYYEDYRYDGNKRQTHRIKYISAGTDGIWYTSDDPVNTTYLSDYDTLGRLAIYTTCTGVIPPQFSYGMSCPGGNYTKYEYDAEGRLTLETIWSVGPDNLAGTSDDLIQNLTTTDGYITYRYDADGNLLEKLRYNGSGADGIWFTSDDRLYIRETYKPVVGEVLTNPPSLF